MLHRPVLIALGCAFAVTGFLIGLAAVFAPALELNPFQASPEDASVNLVTAAVLIGAGAFALALAARSAGTSGSATHTEP